MSQAHFIKAQVVGRQVSHRSAFVANVIALMVVTLGLTLLMCLAAVAPAVWTFATAAAAETHIPVGLSQCLSVKDDPGRLACYDELAGRPAKGARAPFGDVRRSTARAVTTRMHRISIRQAAPDCRCDVPANNRRNNWELTEWNDG